MTPRLLNYISLSDELLLSAILSLFKIGTTNYGSSNIFLMHSKCITMSQFPNIEFVLPWSSLQAQDEEEDEEPDIYPAQDK
jgi:hypothetical protein